jgi:hypothetical protein
MFAFKFVLLKNIHQKKRKCYCLVFYVLYVHFMCRLQVPFRFFLLGDLYSTEQGGLYIDLLFSMIAGGSSYKGSLFLLNF